jgi:hypothetical protein
MVGSAAGVGCFHDPKDVCHYLHDLRSYFGLLNWLETSIPNFEQKIISLKTKQDGTDLCFFGVLPVSRNKKLAEFCSESFC